MTGEARAVEALLFASVEPMSVGELAARLPEGTAVRAALTELAADYVGRGVRLVERGGRWHFETAPDLAGLLRQEREERRPLGRAAMETLAIIAYHEPATRADIEEIRGVATPEGALRALIAEGWVRPAGRREAPGRPLQFATTPAFLAAYGLKDRRELPKLHELKAAGLLDPPPSLFADEPDAEPAA